ncbi:MAG: 23S rRNA (uracil(1939)-C(5))-methyltransferase RlmD, partial [Clostridia bacterium]|nr:23S rRNA (uracil(1939)-C(5))-methyltransferase RlmD [Clostridia bacterium]
MSQTSNLKTNPDACPLAKKCGGCQLQNLPYPRQLKWKQARAEILLKKFGKVDRILGMETPYHYRNKVQAAFGRTRGGKVISGVYQSGTHRIVAVDSCMIEDAIADAIIVTVRSLLPKFRVQVYDEDQRTGFLRHVLVKRGFATGEVMVVLVGARSYFPMKKKFTAALLERHPEITTVLLNINPKDTNLVLGDREEVLFGKGYIEDVLCGCTFRISAQSFYQINPVQTEKLYGKAMALAQLDADTTVIDAYCGIGTIGLVAAKTAGRVIGVELNPEAVRDAIANAKRNGAQNARFYCADAGDFMQELAAAGETADVVFMDPPRAGSSVKFIEALAALQPERIVYISCNPETLARDLARIVRKGYAVRSITPVDMFPHTNHVETVVLLSQQKPKFTVDIDINLDKFDLTAAEAKATYQEIQDYVYRKYKLKVS